MKQLTIEAQSSGALISSLVKSAEASLKLRDAARFQIRVDMTNGPHRCWPWMQGLDQDGYGLFRTPLSQLRAHRVAWLIHKGPIPDDLCVCHKCDNPKCCNQRHLFLATNQGNTQDKVNKGRSAFGVKNGAYRMPERIRKGITHGMHRLKEADVIEVRTLYAGGTKRVRLAQMFACSPGNISCIVTRKTWRHVP